MRGYFGIVGGSGAGRHGGVRGGCGGGGWKNDSRAASSTTGTGNMGTRSARGCSRGVLVWVGVGGTWVPRAPVTMREAVRRDNILKIRLWCTTGTAILEIELHEIQKFFLF